MNNEIAVIGTTFVDCKGFADGQTGAYQPQGRNTGRVRFVHGGVGRNVAENLAGLGVPVTFMSTVDTTPLAQDVLQRLKRSGANVDFVAEEKERGMGLWMVILNTEGEQVGSLSHMPELALLEKQLEEKGAALMKRISHVALEIDLTEEISEKVLALAEQYGRPVYALPGNLSVAMARPEFLPRFAGLICNNIEAGRLFDFNAEALTPEELLERIVTCVDQRGMAMIVVTLGAGGAVYYDRATGEKGWVPAIPTRVTDVSGAGDAFFSGTVCGLVRGKSLREAAELGTKLASLTIQTDENCCRAILYREKVVTV